MKKFEVAKRYEQTYLYENSSLVAGSAQDIELRKAWFLGICAFIQWMQEFDEDTPDDTFQGYMDEASQEVTDFVMTQLTPPEREILG